MLDENKKIIGRAEKISFPELGVEKIYARIDTGARTSAIWASKTEVQNGSLRVVFFDEPNEFYTGQPVEFTEFDKMLVSSSNGMTQERYVVRLLVKLKGKKIRAWFTLADRSTQVYPVLIGRNVLTGKFIVDVKKGSALTDLERQRAQGIPINQKPDKKEGAS